MVVDFSQFSLRQSKSVSPKLLRLMVSGLQVRALGMFAACKAGGGSVYLLDSVAVVATLQVFRGARKWFLVSQGLMRCWPLLAIEIATFIRML